MHVWHVVKMRFVTLLSTKVVKLTLAACKVVQKFYLHGYHVKVQHQRYMERRTPDNNIEKSQFN